MPELSLVVPTFNERGNIDPLLAAVREALPGIDWEMIIVDDDSPDGTAEYVRSVAQHEPRLRCVQRIGRRGLSTACIEGMLSASSPVLAVMDADMQHDPTRIPLMLAEIGNGAGIVVATRSAEGAFDSMSNTRRRISHLSSDISRIILRHNLTDPMSGFFMVRRDVFMGSVRKLSGAGFKILLDLVVSAPADVKIAEVPFVFRKRHAGESKLDANTAWEYLMLLIDKSIGRFIPTRFIAFAMVGTVGVAFHFAILYVVYRLFETDFLVSQAVATAGAIIFNFTLNNRFTFRDRRLKGAAWFRGLAIFFLVSAAGAVANIGAAGFLFSYEGMNWSVAALAGVLFGVVWNYTLSQTFAWRK